MRERSKRQRQHPQTVIRVPTAAPGRQKPQHWQQRRQELLRRERAMAALFGVISLAGTLAMLYVAAQAAATDEGYRRSDLRRAIKALEAENVGIQREIRGLENGNAIGQLAGQRNLVRTPEGIHYFGEKH
ncbi:hypothetical protein [Armatimonas sp.]|uniref:hypothetical protein n=1 Tax=Armatimonas sp. TaxID=1872638 RepID=UPI00286CC574|nr:hypothetical protein [Armatimonas sp.]